MHILNQTIGVIAGTPVDTRFGEEFLKKITNSRILSYAISKTPDDQNLLQLNHPKELYRICLDKCLEFKKSGAKKIVIYCNSLSSSIDILQLEKEAGVKIITPLKVYSNIPDKYRNILIISANSTGAIMPEKLIRQTNNKVKITTLGYLNLVDQIESNENQKIIFDNSGLDYLLKFALHTNIDLILLACTHFPYISNIIKSNTSIDVLDLNQGIEELILQED